MIVDVQKGFLNENCNFVVKKIEKLVGGGNFDQIVATKFVNKNESQYVRFLNYHRFLTEEETELALKLPKSAQIVEKTSYALSDKDFKRLFKKDDEVFVCGMDYDACVLAICFQLFDHEILPQIVLDAVASHSKNPISKNEFEKICRKNFGEKSLIKNLTNK